MIFYFPNQTTFWQLFTWNLPEKRSESLFWIYRPGNSSSQRDQQNISTNCFRILIPPKFCIPSKKETYLLKYSAVTFILSIWNRGFFKEIMPLRHLPVILTPRI